MRIKKNRYNRFTMYPNDAITETRVLQGVVSSNFSNNGGPNTILSVAMQQENISSDTIITCDGDLVAQNYATNFSAVTMNYQCLDDIIVSKTGNDEATIIVTYVPYLTSDYSTTTQYGYNPNTEITGTSSIQVYGVYTAGEIIIAFLLTLLIFLKLSEMLVLALSKVQTKKTFLGYSGGDVEIRKDN